MTSDLTIEHLSRASARILFFAALTLISIAFVATPASAQKTASELETLVAPIALYPDPLLAQVLPAATYPDQVAEAAAYVAQNGTNGVDQQGWDTSVAATARYTEAINKLGN